jgi:hypothetical protein
MKPRPHNLVRHLCFALILALAAPFASAAAPNPAAALAAADDERLAATQAGDPARLEAIFSDALHYAHSSGKVDTKASLIKSLVSHASVYESFDYKERKFTVIGPGLATMTGRVIVKVGPAGKPNELDLRFLAVWREENGRWRFLAWQSCKNPPAVAASASAKK